MLSCNRKSIYRKGQKPMKVHIEFEDIFANGKKFEDCLNDLLDTYYYSDGEGASVPSFFIPVFITKA